MVARVGVMEAPLSWNLQKGIFTHPSGAFHVASNVVSHPLVPFSAAEQLEDFDILTSKKAKVQTARPS